MTTAEKNLQAWAFQNVVSFYGAQRTRGDELYPSERSMVEPVIGRVGSVLDVGCAAGGACSMLRDLNPALQYTGVDSAEPMLQQARALYPDARFELTDGQALPFPDNSFDLVFCVQVMNHNPDYGRQIAEMVRVARKYVVVDLPRLVLPPYTFDAGRSYMELHRRFEAGNDGLTAEVTRVPYVLASVPEAFGHLAALRGVSGVACHGYYGRPHASVTMPVEQVIFTVVLLGKGRGPLRYHLRLPEDAQPFAEQMLRSAGGTAAVTIEALLEA